MSGKRRVLVIDDDMSVGDALGIVLSASFSEVVVATTGSEGLAEADKQTLDVAITDIGLPDMSGLDVLSQLRKRHPAMLVIVMTGQATPEVIDEAMRRGAVRVLQKPFLPSDVLDVINTASTRTP